MADADDTIPDGVFWCGKEMAFLNVEGLTKGGVFFDRWKERRDEFPPYVKARSAAPVPAVPRRRPTSNAIVQGEAAALMEGNFWAMVAAKRKECYDAHIAAGFNRDEALEICIRECDVGEVG